MRRPVHTAMTCVVWLAALGTSGTPAGAQTAAVKAKPALYRYVSYWTFPPAHSADSDNGPAGNQKILLAAIADGTLVGCGDDQNQVHSADGFGRASWCQGKSLASLMKMSEVLHKTDVSSSARRVDPTEHWDQIYTSSYYNWKAGSWKGAYGYSGTFKLRPDAPDPDDVIQALSSFYVPVFEKMLSDGIIVEYELDREMFHSTDTRSQIRFSFVMPDAEAIDRFRAALGDALDGNSLVGPAVNSMLIDSNEQFNFVKVNATFK